MSTSVPPRVGHMLPPSVLAQLLAPTYADANNREAGEVYDEVKSGLDEARLAPLLWGAIWRAMVQTYPAEAPEDLVTHLAAALAKKRGLSPGAAPSGRLDKMAALFAAIDVKVGRASDAARLALESPAGKKLLDAAAFEMGLFLAAKWK